MSSSTSSIKRPKITQKSFYTGGFTCVEYVKATLRMNTGATPVELEDALTAFEEEVEGHLSHDPPMMAMFLDQVRRLLR